MDNLKSVQQKCGYELARPYINRQIYSDSYKPGLALKRGTLFPELYLIESNHYNDWLYENPMNRVKGKKEGKYNNEIR